ncbi:hypothetical protein DUHN55_09970 [Helicobacter pylori]|jgi:outer membrane protein OmpA-like peptidoglycan-associated protein|uniref:OmpA family protein n=1 Tax=unclassified Janibacter TaxID=2649294 RepID=UPI0039D02753
MNGRSRRALIAAAVTPCVLVVGVGAAAADEPLSIDDLPSISDSIVASHLEPIDVPEVEAIDVPQVLPFTPDVSSSGGDTVVTLDTDVLFDFGSAEMSDEAAAAVASAVTKVPKGEQVTVVGHTDSVGSTSDNLALSKKRAQAVADVLGEKRSDLRLRVSGKGEIQPVEPNSSGGKDNPDGREKNRRVEIRYRG